MQCIRIHKQAVNYVWRKIKLSAVEHSNPRKIEMNNPFIQYSCLNYCLLKILFTRRDNTTQHWEVQMKNIPDKSRQTFYVICLATWTFDPRTIPFVGHPKVIPCTKFEHFGTIFWVIVRTVRHTDTHTHLRTDADERATAVGVSNSVQ